VTTYRSGWVEPLPGRRRTPRWLLIALLAVIALIAATLVADRLAAAYAADRVASEIQKQGLNVKPEVKINGFPFLTQGISRDFHDVQVSAHGVRQGPLRISSLNATARGVHLDPSYQKGTIDSLDGTGVIQFADLTSAAGQPALTLSSAGPDKVQAQIDLDVVKGTATAQVTKVGNDIQVHDFSVEGVPLAELGPELDFSVPVPALPMGLTFRSLSITLQGVVLQVAGEHMPFG
jgi:hypothetical protein